MIQCQGSQTRHQIKLDILEALKEQTGYDNTWIVNWVTDGEPKQVNAREPAKNQNVKLNMNHNSNCVDHTFELASEAMIKEHTEMQEAAGKIRKFINYVKDSSNVREFFYKMMTDSGENILALIRGTDNR